ncbi:MAG: uracil-DNA glycosylase [Bacteroidetes bacterium B1(2017)]|nr:MAG: uracil-DNA glycosylase [Bacteroidetes bacterium B1(2017)]
MDVKIEESWKLVLNNAFNQASFLHLRNFLRLEKSKGELIFPPGPQIFEAFNYTPFDKVKIVLLGQDPYHGPQQAHGLSFSVNNGVAFPPSLKNIFKGLQVDYPDYKTPQNGNLMAWAKQGVLLLNSTLTVRAGQAGSHQKKGWEEFTDEVIKQVSLQKEHIVFLLWGSFAISKASLIDSSKHLVLTAVHPSPLSAHRGFYECRHFSKANTYLTSKGLEPINWQI